MIAVHDIGDLIYRRGRTSDPAEREEIDRNIAYLERRPDLPALLRCHDVAGRIGQAFGRMLRLLGLDDLRLRLGDRLRNL